MVFFHFCQQLFVLFDQYIQFFLQFLYLGESMRILSLKFHSVLQFSLPISHSTSFVSNSHLIILGTLVVMLNKYVCFFYFVGSTVEYLNKIYFILQLVLLCNASYAIHWWKVLRMTFMNNEWSGEGYVFSHVCPSVLASTFGGGVSLCRVLAPASSVQVLGQRLPLYMAPAP